MFIFTFTVIHISIFIPIYILIRNFLIRLINIKKSLDRIYHFIKKNKNNKKNKKNNKNIIKLLKNIHNTNNENNQKILDLLNYICNSIKNQNDNIIKTSIDYNNNIISNLNMTDMIEAIDNYKNLIIDYTIIIKNNIEIYDNHLMMLGNTLENTNQRVFENFSELMEIFQKINSILTTLKLPNSTTNYDNVKNSIIILEKDTRKQRDILTDFIIQLNSINDIKSKLDEIIKLSKDRKLDDFLSNRKI